MTTIANTRPATTARATRRPGLLSFLLQLDASYRQSRALRRATDDQLADMGISRKAADQNFLTQYRDNRWTPRG